MFVFSLNNLPKRVKEKMKNLFFKFLIKHFKYLEIYFISNYHEALKKRFEGNFKIETPLKTLQAIEFSIINEERGAYMRFGDGDAYLANGYSEMLQESNPMLMEEMREAFALNGDNIFKSLSIHSETYGFETEMYEGNHLVSNELASNLIIYTLPFFIGTKVFSPISLHYSATYYPHVANSFLKVLKSYTILFVGNESVPPQIVERIFGSIPHIKTPSKNAYKEINQIESEVDNILKYWKGFGVVVIAMGCSGRPLMKRLYKSGYNIFLFDFGSLLDGICGKNTRAWLELEPINYNILLEGL
jgi:hypothetical protein